MEVLFLLGSIQSFFLATLFYSRKKIIHAHKVLILFFALNGFVLLDHYLEIKEIIFSYPHLLGLTYTLPIILGPIIFYYTLILTHRKKPDFKPFSLIHLVPFVLITIYFLFDYYFLSAEEKLIYYYRESQGKTSIAVYITEFLLNFSLPFYSILSILHLRKHMDNIKDKFSFTEDINLKWLKIILYLFTIISAVMLTTNLLSDVIPVMPFLLGDNLIFGSLTIAIFFIGYFGIKQKVIYPETSIQAFGRKQYQKSGLNALAMEENLNRLLEIMEEKKLYCNGNLSLKNLADKMDLTENNLSQLINESLKKNFYDFVNEYRVEDVKKRMLDQSYDHLSLLGIAFDCGFNSKSAFNSVFKKQTGMSPSQFKKLNF